MKFENIINEIICNFPEVKPAYELLIKEWKGDQPGQYIIAETILGDFLNILLMHDNNHARDTLLERIFLFIEKLLESEDNETANLGYIAFLEWHPGWWYARANKYLGERAIHNLDIYLPSWRKIMQEGEDISHKDIIEEEKSGDPYKIKEIVDEILGIKKH